MDVVGDYHNPCPYKEKAEKWDRMSSDDWMRCMEQNEIVESLKKELRETEDYLNNYPNYEGSGTVEVKKRVVIILQKILEGKK